MSLPDFFTAVADLKSHSDRLASLRARKNSLRGELSELDAQVDDAVSAVDVTQKLVAELALQLPKGGK